MEGDRHVIEEPETSGGIGAPGSISRRRLLQGAAAAGLALSAAELNPSSAAAVSAKSRRHGRRRPSAAAAGRVLHRRSVACICSLVPTPLRSRTSLRARASCPRHDREQFADAQAGADVGPNRRHRARNPAHDHRRRRDLGAKQPDPDGPADLLRHHLSRPAAGTRARRDQPAGYLVSNYTKEDAIWASVRDKDWTYGFASFAVDPGHRTSIAVTYYRVNGFGGELETYDTFTLTRRRSDGPLPLVEQKTRWSNCCQPRSAFRRKPSSGPVYPFVPDSVNVPAPLLGHRPRPRDHSTEAAVRGRLTPPPSCRSDSRPAVRVPRKRRSAWL